MHLRVQRDESGRGGLVWLAVAALVAGVLLVGYAVADQQEAPQPPQAAGRIPSAPSTGEPTGPSGPTTSAGPTSSGDPSTAPTPHQVDEPLPASRPVHISIPAVSVRSHVFPIGLADDGSLAVPQPGPRLDQAAWFENSPAPGQPGPAVIEGHVDSTQGPSVFFRLGDVRPGDKVRVRRADGRTVVFAVDAVRDFAKRDFPTRLVYGGKDLSTPQLRLITCSDFDPSIGHHTGNEVVFAHLTAVHGSR